MIYIPIADGIDHVILDVIQALLPLVVFFLIIQILSLKLPGHYIINLFKGLFITLLGMVLFFQGVKIAFLPAGQNIGAYCGTLEQIWILIPLGFLLGFSTTFAEPAVRVLCYQVETSSNGYIRGSLILYALSIGVAFSVSLGMVRILYGFPFLPFIIGGYLLALILIRFTDHDFIAIAFDSGGVATGPMAVTFLMAFAVGVADSIGGRDPFLDGFGMIAFIALTPILTILILGIIFKMNKTAGEIS
ncbi:DUF1538 domain-containing protein [Methanospirillum stamsii]|uniref:DUF1538 domain-containing protein n=1 Tax=Methanospirillum stamsii TaxID=1277351 RepID=A0A2V2MY13_9EURY|nr:DUF1538 domain-containing protein [Methanospirillum stamsii]PWR71175.1 DUF1538 domain-containing protein [Methanospirillum stamsii]